MTLYLIEQLLSNIDSHQFRLDPAAGTAVAVELRMRLICELYEPMRDKLKELVTKDHSERTKKNPKAKRDYDKYWECKLSYIDQGIDEVFHDKLEPIERQKIENFRPLRNKLLHADFVNLMIEMGIPPTSRLILSPDGKRQLLKSPEIKESVLSMGRNQGFERFRLQAVEVVSILDKLIRILPKA